MLSGSFGAFGHCGWSESFGSVLFVRVRPGGRQIHSGWLDSFRRAKGFVVGFFGIIWARPGGRRVHSGSFG